MKPVLIAYNEGIFEFKQKEFLELGETAMEISVLPMLNLRLDSENFGFQLTITIKSHDDELLRYGFVTVMKIAGWIPVTSAGLHIGRFCRTCYRCHRQQESQSARYSVGKPHGFPAFQINLIE